MNKTILPNLSCQLSENKEFMIAVFKSKFYNLTTLQKAAYKFTKESTIKIDENHTGDFEIQFTFPKNMSNSRKEEMLGEFDNEVLDQELREKISKETESVKNLIMANAFSKTSLID